MFTGDGVEGIISLMKKRNQNGFGLVEALLIIIVVGIVGFGGYYVWHTQHNKNSSTSAVKTSNSTTASNMPGSKEFVFKELGVQMTLPNDLKDLNYKAIEGTSVTGKKTTFIYLSSTSFAKTISDCYSNASTVSTASFGALGKADGQYPANAAPDNVDGGLLKQFPSFYIDGSYPNGVMTCDKTGISETAAITSAKSLYASFVDAFKTATLVQ